MIDEANNTCGRLLHIAQELSELAELSVKISSHVAAVPIFTLCGEAVQIAADAGSAVSFSMDDRDQAACVEGHAGRLRQALGLLISVIGRERGTTAMTVTGAISRTSESRAVLVFGEPADAADLNAVVGGGDAVFDRWRGGTGLSLPIACRIIEAHCGVLWSQPGGSRGACAVVLPFVPPP
jgi:signal transduction histidine kinase